MRRHVRGNADSTATTIRRQKANKAARQRAQQQRRCQRYISVWLSQCLIVLIFHRAAFAAAAFSALPSSSLAVDMPDLPAVFDSRNLRAIHLAFDL